MQSNPSMKCEEPFNPRSIKSTFLRSRIWIAAVVAAGTQGIEGVIYGFAWARTAAPRGVRDRVLPLTPTMRGDPTPSARDAAPPF